MVRPRPDSRRALGSAHPAGTERCGHHRLPAQPRLPRLRFLCPQGTRNRHPTQAARRSRTLRVRLERLRLERGPEPVEVPDPPDPAARAKPRQILAHRSRRTPKDHHQIPRILPSRSPHLPPRSLTMSVRARPGGRARTGRPPHLLCYTYSAGNFVFNASLIHVNGSPRFAPASPSAFTVRFPCTPSILPGSSPRRISPACRNATSCAGIASSFTPIARIALSAIWVYGESIVPAFPAFT